jgi:putative transposase
MITRRTLRRTHLLRPDRELTALYTYCLAVLAPLHGIDVHAAVLMSTHEHLIVTDSRGELPRFLQQLHRIVALGVKVLRGWEGAVWDHEKTSVVELRTPQAVIEKLAYVMANPVAAGLVPRANAWPGVTTSPEHLGRARWTAARPDYYFDHENPGWPDTATLRLVMPAIGMADADIVDRAQHELRALELDARENVRKKGWQFLTPERLRQ